MLTALLNELKKQGKIKANNIEFYTEDGKLNILDGKSKHVIKDNNALVSLGNKNRKISKAVDAALGRYF